MQVLLVLIALGWLISLPWASILLWVSGLTVLGIGLCGVAGYVVNSRQQVSRTSPSIDADYLAALEMLLAEAEAENRTLRAELSRSPSTATKNEAASLHARVGLSANAPAWLVASARKAYRSKLHPDRHPPDRKREAERRFKLAEHVFDEIDALGA